MQETSSHHSQPQLRLLSPEDAADLQSMDAHVDVPLLSISGFLRRVPHDKPWGMQNVRRFGAETIKNADGLGCLFQSAIDPTLGPVRVFPVAVIQRTYQQMAPTLGWPGIIETGTPPELEETVRAREALGANERAEQVLSSLLERADQVPVLNSVEVLRDFLRAENERLKEQVAVPSLVNHA